MKKNRYLLPIFILVIGLSFFILNQAALLEQKKISDSDFQEQLGKDLIPIKHAPVEANVMGQSPTVNKGNSLQLCAPFLNDQQGERKPLIQTLQKIRDFYHITVEGLELTEYHLKSNSGESFVIQHDPNEEMKSRVRVFKIAEDGLPDRVYQYPAASAADNKQLEGALSMGAVSKKIEKYKVINSDGTVLLFERSGDEVLKIDFTDGRNQMICRDQLCQCQSF